jgi:WD40 repeat protein
VAFAEDGKTVFSAGRDRKLHAWSAVDGKAQSQTSGFTGDVLRLERAGMTILSAAADGKVRQHAVDKGIPRPATATRPATGPAADDTKKKSAEKPPPRLLLRELDASRDWVYALAVDGKAGLVAAGAQDGKVQVWTLDDAKTVSGFVAAPGIDK